MQHMRVVSVNIGQEETISNGEKSMRSGICKQPLATKVTITPAGLAGDALVDKEHHGGPDQAVYAYSVEDYEWWCQELGTEVPPGSFGENLTIRGMPTDMHVGDRLLIGDCVLEATAPRIPCATLSLRMRDSGFALRFRRAERPGIYFRVLNGGEVTAGDAVTFIETSDTDVSISDLVHFYYDLSPEEHTLRRLLEAPIAERFLAKVESKLA